MRALSDDGNADTYKDIFGLYRANNSARGRPYSRNIDIVETVMPNIISDFFGKEAICNTYL